MTQSEALAARRDLFEASARSSQNQVDQLKKNEKERFDKKREKLDRKIAKIKNKNLPPQTESGTTAPKKSNLLERFRNFITRKPRPAGERMKIVQIAAEIEEREWNEREAQREQNKAVLKEKLKEKLKQLEEKQRELDELAAQEKAILEKAAKEADRQQTDITAVQTSQEPESVTVVAEVELHPDQKIQTAPPKGILKNKHEVPEPKFVSIVDIREDSTVIVTTADLEKATLEFLSKINIKEGTTTVVTNRTPPELAKKERHTVPSESDNEEELSKLSQPVNKSQHQNGGPEHKGDNMDRLKKQTSLEQQSGGPRHR